MRRFSNRARSPLLGLACVAAVVLALPALASAKNKYGDKVDDRVAAITDAAIAQSGANTELQLLVFGRDGKAATAKVGGADRRDLDLIGSNSATIKAKDLAALAADANVDYVAPDFPVLPTADSAPAVDFSSLATLYPLIDNADQAWSQDLTGAGVGIAVIDSGVTPVADFGSRLVQVPLPDKTGSLDDAYGHGSLVAGVAAGSSADGRYIGIAPGATVYAINIARADGVYTSDVIAGIDWVLKNAARYKIGVILLSLSETTPSSYLASPLDVAVEQAWRQRIVVVASAGNLGPGTAVAAPANDPFVITVGSVDNNDTLDTADDSVASFSATGPTPDGFAKPELLAPGRHIVSILPAGTRLAAEAPVGNLVAPGYGMISGTSFSAPQVAGAAAILMQQHPSWTPDQVKSVLTRTTRAVSGSVAGTLDLRAAVAFAGNPGSTSEGVTMVATSENLVKSLKKMTFNSAAWNSAAWNSAAWNSAAWNSAAWNSAAWNSAAWNSAAWNSAAWNSAAWN